MTTPLLGMTEWTENQNQPHVPVNAMIRELEVLSTFAVVEAVQTAPAGSADEDDGSVFLVGAGATGTWAGHDDDIAYYSNGLQFIAPRVGMVVYVVLTDEVLQYGVSTTGWATPSWVGTTPVNPYDVGSMGTGVPTASLVMMRYPFPRQVVFPAGLTGSRGVAEVAATAQTDFDIKKNGSSVGTMRFAASATTATFIMASQTTFVAGDILRVVAPGTPDATLSGVGFGLAGTR
jgi:hypothetical protein